MAFDKKNNVDTPENRLQGEQNTDLVESVNQTSTPASSFSIETGKAQGSVLKQDVAAAVIAKGKGGQFVSGESSTRMPSSVKAGRYSGDSAGYLGSAAGTPTVNKSYQGETRVDKKISDANKEINFRASEQVATEFEHTPYLREGKGTVGLNGNPANVAARSQKKTGLVPADPLYDRSVDEIRADTFLFTTGQVVQEHGVIERSYPKRREVLQSDGSYKITSDFDQVRGNYSPRYIHVILGNKNNTPFLKSFEVIEDDFSCNNVPYSAVNDSSAQHRIDMNRAEIARQNIDAKHGSPVSDRYSPLGRSTTTEVTPTVAFLQDIESTTGAIAAGALRFANKSKAYFLSRTGKDGQLNLAPGLDALYGHLVPSTSVTKLSTALGISADDTNPTSGDSPFYSRKGCVLGSAFTLVGVFDSLGKYKTKGDLVNQARGLKLPLQTGMNNHMPLRVKKEFMRALNAIDVFSTIDRGYDPMSAVCVTDAVRYVLPYSWNRALKFTRDNPGEPRNYASGSKLFSYGYMAGDGNQKYIIKVGEPTLNGIAWFIEQHVNSIYKMLRKNGYNGDVNWYIPVVSYGTRFSLWDYLVAGSLAYIDYERTNSCKDILDLDEWGDYPFMLENVSKDELLSPTNYGKISDVSELSVREMLPISAMRWIYPEHFSPVKWGGNETVMLPWYVNERNYNFIDTESLERNDRHGISTPIIRSGVRLKYLDDFFGLEPLDQVLALDKITYFPFEADSFEGRVYKYSLACDGQVVLGSNVATAYTLAQLCSSPRQLGFIMPARAYQTRILTDLGDVEDDGAFDAYDGDAFSSTKTTILNCGSSFSIRIYKGVESDVDLPQNTILNVSTQNVNRGQAFSQNWYDLYAYSGSVRETKFDIIVAGSQCLNGNNSPKADVTSFKPFLLNKVQMDGNPSSIEKATGDDGMFSAMRMYWARIQKLPFVINPFDNMEEDGGYVDPYDMAYFLGLAGFYSANYDEELQNREAIAVSEQFAFIHDPYIEKSPLFK